MNKVTMHPIAKLRKYFFHLRKSGIKGLVKLYQLNKFEESIFSKKKLKWDNLGYWKVDPMPTEEELQKFYSQIYWVSNHVYKNYLLTPRDLDHFIFLEKKISDKITKNLAIKPAKGGIPANENKTNTIKIENFVVLKIELKCEKNKLLEILLK